MTAMLPANLTETLNNVRDAARVLATEVRDDRKQREAETRVAAAEQRRQNRIMVTGLVIVALLVLTLLTIVVQNRLRANQNSEILRQTANTSARIADCTTVGGTCYKQGNERTGDAVRLIIRAEIYHASCAKVHETDAAIEACVMDRLLASTGSATPAPSPRPSVVPSPSPR